MTLMEHLMALRNSVEIEPEPHISGPTMLERFQTTGEDFLEFQESMKIASTIAAQFLGSSTALDGMIQTALTIGWQVRDEQIKAEKDLPDVLDERPEEIIDHYDQVPARDPSTIPGNEDVPSTPPHPPCDHEPTNTGAGGRLGDVDYG